MGVDDWFDGRVKKREARVSEESRFLVWVTEWWTLKVWWKIMGCLGNFKLEVSIEYQGGV